MSKMTTIDTYNNNLNRLEKDNIDYINIANIDEFIDNLKNVKNICDSAVRTYLCAILWFYKNNNLNENNIKIIRKKITEINSKISANYDKNLMNEKETEVYLDWETIVDIYKNLYEKRNNSLVAFKKCICIGLYVLFPPRRAKDYCNMKVVERKEECISEFNYYIIGEKKLLFTDYKTAKIYGEQYFDICEELANLLEEYILKYNLVGKEIISMTNNDFSEKIKNIFIKETGKGATINTLRHSFINFIDKKMTTTEERKIIAFKMGHSHVTQQDIYKKKI